eukprot:1020690-Pelagomonas_calceolata.AAC.6
MSSHPCFITRTGTGPGAVSPYLIASTGRGPADVSNPLMNMSAGGGSAHQEAARPRGAARGA